MVRFALILLFASLTVPSWAATTCDGHITEVNHWSDGQDNKVNFKLTGDSGSMWVQTKTKEHVSMVLMSIASKMDTRVYWSCNEPASCTDSQAQQLCGHLTLINN